MRGRRRRCIHVRNVTHWLCHWNMFLFVSTSCTWILNIRAPHHIHRDVQTQTLVDRFLRMRTQNLRVRGRTPTPKYPRPHISGDYGIDHLPNLCIEAAHAHQYFRRYSFLSSPVPYEFEVFFYLLPVY